MARRTYTQEFKDSAARLVTEQGYSLNQAAKSLGVTPASIREWVQKLPRVAGASNDDPSALQSMLTTLNSIGPSILFLAVSATTNVTFLASGPASQQDTGPG